MAHGTEVRVANRNPMKDNYCTAPQVCDASHLNRCDNESACTAAGGSWDGSTCGQPKSNEQKACEASGSGGTWKDGKCVCNDSNQQWNASSGKCEVKTENKCSTSNLSACKDETSCKALGTDYKWDGKTCSKVTAEIKKHKVTVTYVVSDNGATAPQAQTIEVEENKTYEIKSPSLTGYTPDKASVTGTMGTSDISVTVTYTKSTTECAHDWKENNRVDATCDAAGKIDYKCSKCGATKTDILPQLTDGCSTECAHDWQKENNRVDATCDAAGKIDYKCSKCGATKTDILPQLTDGCSTECAHDWQVLNRVEPSCTAAGKIDYKCSKCGTTRTDVLPQLTDGCSTECAHDWQKIGHVDPTCETEGKIDYECSKCKIIKTEILSKLTEGCCSTECAHDWQKIGHVDPTCETEGKIDYECSKCKIIKTEILSKLTEGCSTNTTPPTTDDQTQGTDSLVTSRLSNYALNLRDYLRSRESVSYQTVNFDSVARINFK